MVTKTELVNFLEGITCFKEFEEKLSKVDIEKVKGDLFELFCKAYLIEIYPEEFKLIERFEDIKDVNILNKLNLKQRKDYGIDFIAITNADEIWCIQAKFRTSNTLIWKELSTFMASSEKANFKLVIGNINQILHPHKRLDNFSSVLRYDFNKLNEEDFKRIRNYLGNKEIIKKFEPRQHQVETINKAVEHFKKNDKGLMIHACGTGKTLTSLWIKEKLKPKNTIVFVPSLSLLKQTLEEWFKHRTDKFNLKCVCSDPTVSKGKNDLDEPIVDLTELGVPVTTNIKEVKDFLIKDEDKIIFSTYQSTPIILEALKLLKDFSFDFGVFDEAHRTASRLNKLFSLCLNVPIKKKLFMTATPKIYLPHLKKRAEEEDILLCSMDDENIYGKVFDEIKFGQAIKLGLLSDYKIKVILVNNKDIQELIDRRYWLEVLGKELTADDLAKIWALIQSMDTVNHVISFHSRISKAKEFQENLTYTLELLKSKGKEYQDIKSFHISGNLPTYERSNILSEFITQNKSLVTNARCLTEGVDVPAIDGIYFVEPKKNLIDIVQATGRAIRKKPKSSSQIGYIIIPIFINEEEDLDKIIDSSAFKQVWDVIEAMKDQDERLQHIITELKELEGKKKFGSLKSRENDEERELKKDLGDVLDLGDTILPINFNFDEFIDKVKTKTIDIVGISWDSYYGQLKKFYEDFNKEPYEKSDDIEEKKLARWVFQQRRNYRKGILQKYPERIKKLEELKFRWEYAYNINWDKTFQELKEFYNKNKRWPNSRLSNIEERNLGQWCSVQRMDYRNNILSNKRKEKLLSINFDFTPLENLWDETFKELKAFYNKNNRWPSAKSKDEEERHLGEWCNSQKWRYRNKLFKMFPERIQKLNEIGYPWNKFDFHFEDMLKSYIEFKTKHKKEPSSESRNLEERHIGMWCQSRRQSFNKGILGDDEIKKLKLVNFPFNPFEERFYNKCQEYLTFKNKYNREPTEYKNNSNEEKKLTEWALNQRYKYNKNKFSNYPEFLSKLKEINFAFIIKTDNELWNEKYQEFSNFLKKKQRHPKISSKDMYEKKLAIWETSQRNNYRITKFKDTLERLNKLKEVGIIFDKFNLKWEQQYEKYKLFIQKNKREPIQSIKEEKAIASWASIQRLLYKKTKFKDNPEKLNKLNDIEFVWNLKKSSWDIHYEKYMKFIELNKREPTQSKNQEENSLGCWVLDQRKRYKKDKFKNNPERLKKLNELGFKWKIYKK